MLFLVKFVYRCYDGIHVMVGTNYNIKYIQSTSDKIFSNLTHNHNKDIHIQQLTNKCEYFDNYLQNYSLKTPCRRSIRFFTLLSRSNSDISL